MVAVLESQMQITDLPDGVSSEEELNEKLKDRLWRLNNLYWIKDQWGKRIKFKMNAVQYLLYYALWWLNVILKSRQHGITTFVCIYFLDDCFFNSNTSAGIIAHKLKDAQKIFQDKIKYAYDNMPEVLRNRNKSIKDSADTLILQNQSSIYVSVSMRSTTLQLLHVSEYGWMCAYAPLRAKEVKTGALETIHEGGLIIIESTGEGIENDFHLLCKTALKMKQEKVELTRMDYRFHFFPWYFKDSNQLDAEVVIDEKMSDYFRKVEAVTGDKIGKKFKAWYVKKKATARLDIYKQHPSIPDEAFIANLDGAYFGHGMVKVQEDRRIGFYPWDQRVKVFTMWDIGTIHTAIWFWQFIAGEIRSIESFYDNTGQGLETFAKMLKEERDYVYAEHYCGWDLNPENGSNRKNQTTGCPIVEDAERLGIPLICLPKYSFQARITAVRDVLGRCTFNEETNNIGVPALFNFRQAKNEALSTNDRIVFSNNPAPGPENHIADAFSHGALAYLYHIIINNERIGYPRPVPASAGIENPRDAGVSDDNLLRT